MDYVNNGHLTYPEIDKQGKAGSKLPVGIQWQIYKKNLVRILRFEITYIKRMKIF
jgi:hypothetical protein